MHYFCAGGCEGVASEPGRCQDPDCPDFDLPLHECDCKNGAHGQGAETMPVETEEEGE